MVNMTAESVVTKTGNNRKWPQKTTNNPKPLVNDDKLPQTTIKHKKTTTSYQQTTTNHQKTTTNDQINLFRIPFIFNFFVNWKQLIRRSLTDVDKHWRLTVLCNLIYTYLMNTWHVDFLFLISASLELEPR